MCLGTFSAYPKIQILGKVEFPKHLYFSGWGHTAHVGPYGSTWAHMGPHGPIWAAAGGGLTEGQGYWVGLLSRVLPQTFRPHRGLWEKGKKQLLDRSHMYI